MSLAQAGALALVSAIAWGCGASDSPRDVDVGGAGGHAPSAVASSVQSASTAAASSASSGAGGGDGVAIAATSGVLELPFTLNVQGAGSSLVGAIAVAKSAGTVTIGGRAVPAVVYERQAFDDYALYQALAVTADRLYVLWFYCLQGALKGVWLEGTHGPAMTTEAANGVCEVQSQPSSPTVSFPAVQMTTPPLVAGYTVTGTAIHIDGPAPGTLVLDGRTYEVLTFGEVDCSTCGKPGWRELHGLLRDASTDRVCFAIVYLREAAPVLVTYALCLPDLSDPIGTRSLEATWAYAGP